MTGKGMSTMEVQQRMYERALEDQRWYGGMDKDDAIYRINDIRNWGIGFGKR